MLKIVSDDADHDDLTVGMLDGLVSEGARSMLVAALEAEVGGYVDRRQEPGW